MNLELRQVQMYNYIKEKTEVSVDALARQFQVSQVTIRRTLKRLEDAKLITHAYGKAHIVDTSRTEFAYTERAQINHAAKERMAQIALRIIQSKEIKSIYLDGSSSAMAVAEALPSSSKITVFSNSLSILDTFREKPNIRTFLFGGFIDWRDRTASDITTEDQCKQIYVDATLTSCSGFSENGTFNNGFTGSQIRRIMVKNSLQNYLLADHSKLNNQGVFLLNTWDCIDGLITDEPLPPAFLEKMRSYNVEVFCDLAR